ncbi:hypothetical protein Gpo141_00009060 [Globisporangium polare]
MSQDPYKPSKEVEVGVPVDYQYAQQQQYPPPPYGAAVGVPVAAPPPQHLQVDQFGRPIVTAVPAQMHVTTHVVSNNANIRRDAQGNALCNKCSAPYPLPAGATSWRCRQCHELNNASIYGDECCTIL